MPPANEPPSAGETPFDLSGLKDPSIRTRRDLDLAEARNVAKAVEKYLLRRPSARKAPFDVTWILKLHREMFGDVWQWAGIARTENLNVGVPVVQINEQLQTLVDDLQYWKQHWPDVLQQAVHLHVAAVRVHPFPNGNGRWSRMLANIWLCQQRHPLTEWPVDLTTAESPLRADYIRAVKLAVNHHDYAAIMAIHRDHTQKSD